MKHLFPEEQDLTQRLSEEWLCEVQQVIKQLGDTFSRKSSERDKSDVVWRRLAFPDGFLTVIYQKMERFEPLLAGFSPRAFEGINPAINTLRWPKVVEEALDIASYLIFFAAIAKMFERRMEQRLNGGGTTPFPVEKEKEE